ncbi:MAG TPA: class I SAM-dependent rRNA methyltransferase [bacterium]|nr:class I SAM-dependent rRNA methyltransferase [bacterium]
MPSYVRVKLKRKEEDRLLAGHPWVFANEVDGIPKVLTPGALVEVVTAEGAPVGRGVANPTSKILVRLLTRGFERELDGALIAERVERALAVREGMGEKAGTDALRLFFGEADGLPGVIADAFGRDVVLSCYSAGMKPFLPDVVSALEKKGYASVYEKSAGESVQKEGMAEVQEWRTAPGKTPFTFTEGRAKFTIDPGAGQKTGFYLDFREARRRVAALAQGRSVLDAFCYTGAAAVQAALGGAKEVLALDSSQSALEEALSNARLNGVEGKITFERQDSFKIFRELKKAGRNFDGILLDPPPLAKSVHELPGGRAALKRMLGNALDLLNPGGWMVVASCSHHFSWTVLEGVVREAVEESGRSFRLSERLSQPADHPMVVSIPETEYLRALVLEEAGF